MSRKQELRQKTVWRSDPQTLVKHLVYRHYLDWIAVSSLAMLEQGPLDHIRLAAPVRRPIGGEVEVPLVLPLGPVPGARPAEVGDVLIGHVGGCAA